MRLRNDPLAKQILDQNPNLCVFKPQEFKAKWNQLFDNNQPIYLEIGSGKGQFIINQALKNPNINFIGLEKNTVVCSKIVKNYLKLESKLTNLKIVNIDANQLLNIFNQQEISHIFLNFSDPWPKKRHYKNRLTHDNFLNLFYVILKTNGLVEFKTDNDDLYNWSLEHLSNHPKWKIIYYTNDLYGNLNHEYNQNNIQTEYEIKFLNQNKNINKIIFKKQ